MEDPEIPKVASEHLGPQPLPEINHFDCAGVNCTQKKAWRQLDGGLHIPRELGFYEELRQLVGFVCCLSRK